MCLDEPRAVASQRGRSTRWSGINVRGLRIIVLRLFIWLTLVGALSHVDMSTAHALPSRTPPKSKGIKNTKINPLNTVKLNERQNYSCYEQGSEVIPGRNRSVLVQGTKGVRRIRYFFPQDELERSWRKWYRAKLTARGLRRRAVKKRMQAKKIRRAAKALSIANECREILYRNPIQCEMTISTEDVQFQFQSDPTYGVIINSIVIAPTSQSALAVTPAKYPLWKIGMLAEGAPEEDEFLRADSSGIVRCIPNVSTGGIEYRWEQRTPESGGQFNISIFVSPNPNDGTIEFKGSINVDENTTGAQKGVGSFFYPQIVATNSDATSQLIKGLLAGIAINDPLTNAVEQDASGDNITLSGVYPREQTMAVDALTLQNRVALIMSTNDPRELHLELKDFFAGSLTPQFAEPGVSSGILMTVKRTPVNPYTLQDNLDTGTTTFGGKTLTNPDHLAFYDIAEWYKQRRLNHLERVALRNLPSDDLRKTSSLVTLIGADLERGFQFADNVSYIRDVGNFLGTPNSENHVIWYDWHSNTFDKNLPEHWPPRNEFSSSIVSEMKSLGLGSLGVYINPTFWHDTVPSFSERGILLNGAALRSDGSTYGGQHGADLDPASPQGYRYSLEEVFQRVIDTFGMNAAYNDVFPWVHRCYATNHGHPVGGGAHILEAALKYANDNAAYIAATGREPFLFSEGTPEPILEVDYYGLSNQYRFINYKQLPVRHALNVPLWDAIYREYITVASQLILDMPGESLLQQTKDLARATGNQTLVEELLAIHFRNLLHSFVLGQIPVLIHRPIPDDIDGNTRLQDDAYASSIIYALKAYLLLYRHEGLRPLLHGGALAPPLDGVSTQSSEVLITSQLYPENPENFPHVLYGTFRSESAVLIMLGNWTTQSENISFVIDPDKFGIPYENGSLRDTWEVIQYTPKTDTGAVEEVVLTRNLNENLSLLIPTLSVPPRRVTAYLVRKAP